MASFKYKDANGEWKKVGLGRGVNSLNGKYGDVTLTGEDLDIAADTIPVSDETASALGLETGASVDDALGKMESLVSAKAPAYSYGTEDLVAGTTPLETGKLYFVCE